MIWLNNTTDEQTTRLGLEHVLNNEEYSYGVLCEALALPDPISRAEWHQEQVRIAYMEMSGRVGGSCMWSDLLTLSMSRVNRLEIVENQD